MIICHWGFVVKSEKMCGGWLLLRLWVAAAELKMIFVVMAAVVLANVKKYTFYSDRL